MERIHQIDRDQNAAIQRLLLAVALSLLLHGIAVWFGPGRVSMDKATEWHAHLVSPRAPAFSASLQHSASVPDLRPALVPSSGDRPGPVSRLEAPDPRYYPVEELDVLPIPRRPIELAETGPMSGQVRLLTRIDASGRVTGVSVFDSGAPDAQNAAAINALRRAAFSAARKAGRLVRSEVVIELAGARDQALTAEYAKYAEAIELPSSK